MALIEEGSAIFEEMGDAWGLGWVFFAKSCLFANQKDYAGQRKMLEKSLACFEQAGDILLSESYKYSLFYCTLFLRDYETARRLAERSLEFFRKVNHKTFTAYSLVFLGQIAHLQEDFGRTETCCQEALELFNEMGMSDPIVWTYRTLGCCVIGQGQLDRARQLLLKSQSLGRKLPNGDPSGDLAFVLWMGTIAESQGQLALAARFLGAVEAVLETFFKPLDIVDQIEYERLTGKLRGALDETALTAAWAEGRKLSLEAALEEALVYCRSGA
jgi:tetratricopeptide (TPR) repeat protein